MTLADDVNEEYDEWFDEDDKKLLKEKEVSSKVANEYDRRQSAENIIQLVESRIHPIEAKGYNPRFKGHFTSRGRRTPVSSARNTLPRLVPFAKESMSEMMALDKAGCSPETADEYDESLKGWNIVILYTMGITPDKLTEEQSKKIARLFDDIDTFIVDDARTLIGTGACGAVLSKGDRTWKFSMQVEREYELLKRIQDRHSGKQKNVVKIKGELQEGLMFEIENIQGRSIERFVKDYFNPKEKEILRYGRDIINGLIEMRQAGIWYHRDLRPANIMIDEAYERAVIIDLGLGTTNKEAFPEKYQWYNRRYGGSSDLISLGQIIYFMATGRHVFAQSKSMTKSFSDISDEINDYRVNVYSDKNGNLLNEHLRKVDENVGDEKIRELIKSCLTAKRSHYKKMHRMFQRYAA